jgi:ribosome biogenesis GTPase A
MMEAIGRRRGLLLKGNQVDYDRLTRMLLDEFRAGQLGRISLERP